MQSSRFASFPFWLAKLEYDSPSLPTAGLQGMSGSSTWSFSSTRLCMATRVEAGAITYLYLNGLRQPVSSLSLSLSLTFSLSHLTRVSLSHFSLFLSPSPVTPLFSLLCFNMMMDDVISIRTNELIVCFYCSPQQHSSSSSCFTMFPRLTNAMFIIVSMSIRLVAFDRCRYPRTGREVAHHIHIVAVRRVPEPALLAPTLRSGHAAQVRRLSRAVELAPHLDSREHNGHAGPQLSTYAHRGEEVARRFKQIPHGRGATSQQGEAAHCSPLQGSRGK